MSDSHNLDFDAAYERILDLSYRPVTLPVHPVRAFGHRLAKPVIARGNQPSRPVALVDGLAVLQRDVQARDATGAASPPPEVEDMQQLDSLPPLPPGEEGEGEEGQATQRAKAADPTGRHVMRLAGDEERDGDDWTEDEASGEGSTTEDNQPVGLEETNQLHQLQLRPRPMSSRREDALALGQAVPVAVGSEVPRGADLIYPLAAVAGEPEPYDFEVAPMAERQTAEQRRREERGRRPRRESARDRETQSETEQLPDVSAVQVPEPSRAWDLPGRFASGPVGLPVSRVRLPRRLIPIGAWAHNREVLLPERVMLRATELALLSATGVDEVEIYRRPVVGVVSLGQAFPQAGQAPDQRRPGADPLSVLVQFLCKGAQVACLPLGFAPPRFRQLRAAVELWAQQCDILLLVGGSHHGPRCLGHDVLASFGDVLVSGIGLEPAGALSAGYAGRTPLLVIPGSLPDVLAGFVLFARPLAHKYFLPQHFLGELPVSLDYGSRLRFDQTTAVPLRFSYDRERGLFRSRYAGQHGEPWLDCFRGQALAVFEAGREYADGETVHAAVY